MSLDGKGIVISKNRDNLERKGMEDVFFLGKASVSSDDILHRVDFDYTDRALGIVFLNENDSIAGSARNFTFTLSNLRLSVGFPTLGTPTILKGRVEICAPSNILFEDTESFEFKTKEISFKANGNVLNGISKITAQEGEVEFFVEMKVEKNKEKNLIDFYFFVGCSERSEDGSNASISLKI